MAIVPISRIQRIFRGGYEELALELLYHNFQQLPRPLRKHELKTIYKPNLLVSTGHPEVDALLRHVYETFEEAL